MKNLIYSGILFYGLAFYGTDLCSMKRGASDYQGQDNVEKAAKSRSRFNKIETLGTYRMIMVLVNNPVQDNFVEQAHICIVVCHKLIDMLEDSLKKPTNFSIREDISEKRDQLRQALLLLEDKISGKKIELEMLGDDIAVLISRLEKISI